MTKEMTILLVASANTQEGIEYEFGVALEEVLRLVREGYSYGTNSRDDGDEETNLEWTAGGYEFSTITINE